MKQQYLWRLLAVGLAAGMAALSVGCGKAESSSEGASGENTGVPDSEIFENLEFSDETDLEYGATMRDNSDYGVTVEYDRRFLEDGEVQALAQYYTAIQTEDVALYDQCTPDFYVTYYLENVYGGLLDEDAYLAQQNRTFSEQLDGADVNFTRLSVTSCTEDNSVQDEGIAALEEMYIQLEGQDSFDANWQGCKLLTVEPTLSSDATSLVGGSMNIFIVQLEDGYYICA